MRGSCALLAVSILWPLDVEGSTGSGSSWGGLPNSRWPMPKSTVENRRLLPHQTSDEGTTSWLAGMNDNDSEEDDDDVISYHSEIARTMRAGYQGGVDESPSALSTLDQTVSTAIKFVTSTCRIILPPVVATVRAVVAFYAALPIDAVMAQVGLVYCFAGGYFPTLFAAIQAAEHCGWQVAVQAVDCLVDEAVAAIRACDLPHPSRWNFQERRALNAGKIFTEKTMIVIKTIDPMKINQAVAALYTTWMGISTVLERQFARTIALSVTIGEYLRPLTNFLLAPPAYRVVPEAYHKWVPVVLGWGCKAAAMSVAWRIQRVITAYSSAVAGGLMFTRSIFRMLRKRGVRLMGIIPEDPKKGSIDEVLGCFVAAAGLYFQIGNGLSFKIPFPLSLVTWPFEIAERWIQWTITKDIADSNQRYDVVY